MDLGRPLAVVTPTVDADVLGVLAGADASFTGRQVHRLAGRYSENGVRKALHRLVAQGIVSSERVGGAEVYALNRDHLAAPHIVAMAGLRAELLQRIGDSIRSWKTRPLYAALFGSAARGDMNPDSDIDLLVVRPEAVGIDDTGWRAQLDSLSRQVSAWTGNDARVLELGEDEVERGIESRAHVLVDVIAEGLPLFGPRGYLSSRCQKIRTGHG